MKLRQGNMLTSLETTRRFLDDNAAALAAVITAEPRLKLDKSIAEISWAAVEQNQYTRDRKGSFAVQERAVAFAEAT